MSFQSVLMSEVDDDIDDFEPLPIVSDAAQVMEDSTMTFFNILNTLPLAQIMTVLTVILLFFFAQRYFIKGIVMTGLKG